MKKIFNHYIVSETEMDRINYLMDFYRKYQVMAELNWDGPEVGVHEENPADNL